MIRVETDADVINRIANHPAVLPYFDLGKSGALDFAECIARPQDYVVLSDGWGCCSLMEWSAPTVWQAHSLFLPEVRGREAIAKGKAMLVWMFAHGASMIWGETPAAMRHAALFNRAVGFKKVGERDHPVLGATELYAIRRA